ncbi:hypothetical protein GCM10018987_54030 [Streptomyces cremeus]
MILVRADSGWRDGLLVGISVPGGDGARACPLPIEDVMRGRIPFTAVTVAAACVVGVPVHAAPGPSADPVERLASAARDFDTVGDPVHFSSTPPASASAHSWWETKNPKTVSYVVSRRSRL